MSHPAWVCGLKLGDTNYRNIGVGSHPAWVCGLKLPSYIAHAAHLSHTLRGCVD